MKEDKELFYNKKKKIVFFAIPRGDSFLDDIITFLSQKYETKKIIATSYKVIQEGLNWADICWFEWCDALIIYASKLKIAEEKKIICRLHSYEAFTDNMNYVNWNNVDKLIFVAGHIKNIVIKKIKIDSKKICVIPNGVDIEKYKSVNNSKGFNIAFQGYIDYKKGFMLLLHTFKSIFDKDNRYKLYIAGKFNEERYLLYFEQMIREMGLQNSVFFDGWQNDMNKWLRDKQYILSTSVLEGHPVGIMEAMAKGIKPIIHNFVGAKNVFPQKYIWNTIDEAVKMITSDDYDSMEYRYFIENKYTLKKQLYSVNNTIEEVISMKKIKEKNILNVVKTMLNNKQEFEGMEDMTLFMATYNRGEMVKNDLENGYKLGNQRKLLVDDCSSEKDIVILKELVDGKSYGIEDIIFHEENKGTAISTTDGIINIKTKYTMISGDDDLILCRVKEKFNNDYLSLKEDYTMIIPRYIINLNYDGKLSIGYDRSNFNDASCEEILKTFAITGEIYAFIAGNILETDALRNVTQPEKIILSGEDYILISRIFSKNLNKKVKVSDSYIYVRRVNDKCKSQNITTEKLAVHLLEILVPGYYCLKNKIVTSEELINALKYRGDILVKKYGYGKSFSTLVIMYLLKQISLDELIKFVSENNIIKGISINNIPKEVTKIVDYIDIKNSNIIKQ